MACASAAQVAVKLVGCDNPGAADANNGFDEFDARHWAAHHSARLGATLFHQKDQGGIAFLQFSKRITNGARLRFDPGAAADMLSN